jgi:hypothetical protein
MGAIGQDAIPEICRRLQPDAPWVLDRPHGSAWCGWRHRQDIRPAPAVNGHVDGDCRVRSRGLHARGNLTA